MPTEPGDDVFAPRAVEQDLPAFARLMGVRITSAARDRIEGELPVGGDLTNR